MPRDKKMFYTFFFFCFAFTFLAIIIVEFATFDRVGTTITTVIIAAAIVVVVVAYAVSLELLCTARSFAILF